MRTHQVPKEMRKEVARTMRASTAVRGAPTDAERSRTLLLDHRTGSLATQSVECPGFPFGSLVAYAVDEEGRPILALSDIAEHSRNIAADPRGSLIVSNTDDASDPLALARLTLIGEIARLEGDEGAAAVELYREWYPQATYTAFGDFEMYRLEVASVRYVGGFGRMSWVSLEDYLAAEPDPIRPRVQGILEHMNADHADALIAYSRTFGNLAEVESAELVGVDRYGMDLMVAVAGSADRRAVRVPFGEVLEHPDQVRMATVRLLREARERLGIPQVASKAAGAH